jgi:hypothetical protein
VLAIPAPESSPPRAPKGARAFAWNRDSLWQSLEGRFTAAREAGCAGTDTTAARESGRIAAWLDSLGARPIGPADPLLDSLEADYFALGPLVAACAERVRSYVAAQGQIRARIKDQSRTWSMDDDAARDRLYRALYGTRAAVEEVLLNHPEQAPALLAGRDEPSATPSAVVHGVRVHSGDMLVSRGGAPTSALIARGSDYPGNFSHVALVHVDSVARVSVIEAHIEVGVAVATAERYLKDRKLRIMVLRPRADLPATLADPMLPHRAATMALERVRSGHIAYDFGMDYTDPSSLFCSEVPSSVYRELGITLWTRTSTISSPGLRSWLYGFGVTHFETQEPSDLEYDPQLIVVAEWRDPEALRDDHIDNAVIDVMLEGAEEGDALEYPWYLLPVGRVMKGYSWIKERAGSKGPVPEGMSAPSALRNREFSARQKAWAKRVKARAEEIEKAQGYPPPYWELVRIARGVK